MSILANDGPFISRKSNPLGSANQNTASNNGA